MARRIAAHLGLLWLFARRCLLYNVALSLLGSSALFAVSLASAEPGQVIGESALRALHVAAVMCAVLVMTGGHLLAVLAMRLFHGRELPYYRNAGLGEGALAVAAWALSLVAGGVLLVAGLLWT